MTDVATRDMYAGSRARSAETPSRGTDASRGRLVYTVQVSCLLCGRAVAELVSGSWPLPSDVTIRPVGAMPQAGVGWRDLRCEVCGGNTWLGDVETQWVHPPVDWSSIRPRVGRPPKRLAQALTGPVAPGGQLVDDWLAPEPSPTGRTQAGRRIRSWRAPRCPPGAARRAGPGP